MFAALAALGLAAGFPSPGRAQDPAERIEGGRFTVLSDATDRGLAKSLLAAALANDTFPGLARPRHAVVIAIAANDAKFRELVGQGFPEWGAAAAFPDANRIVMHGHRAGSDAGNPIQVLRHELAHLALGEALGDLPPRWFDEGYASYAADEWGREEMLETSVALVFRGPSSLAALDSAFYGGATRATGAYALAYRAVVELAALDPDRGLSLFFVNWKKSESLDVAVRQSYGMTLDSFDQRWRARTRRRYGALALVADVSIIAGIIGIALLPMYLGRRKRQRKRLETLRINEAEQERRARESALDALLSGGSEIRDPRLLDTPKDDL